MGLLQTILLQNMQIQTSLMQNLIPKQNEDIIPYKRRYENYQVRRLQLQPTATKKASMIAPTKTRARQSQINVVFRKWKPIALGVIFALRISKKYRLSKIKPSFDYAREELPDLYAIHENYIKYKEIVKELAAEGADLLMRDGLGYLFQKRPSKNQQLKFGNALQCLVDLVCSVRLDGCSKNLSEGFKKIVSRESMPKYYTWDNERFTSIENDDISISIDLLYLCIVKSLLLKNIFTINEMTDLEERCYRSTAMILYRVVRMAAKEPIVSTTNQEIDSQFTRAMQGFIGSYEEANLWTDATCKLLFKTFEALMKTLSIQLLEWCKRMIDDVKLSHIEKFLSKEQLKEDQGNNGYVPSFVKEMEGIKDGVKSNPDLTVPVVENANQN